MIDNIEQAVELMEHMKSHLPIPVRPTRELMATLKGKSQRLPAEDDWQIESVLYLGDEGGIACGIRLPEASTQAVVVSLTHLRVDVGHPLSQRMRAYQDGIETFVIRPGFSGKVEDFGMLISFPTPPALRKVSEDIFPQIGKAIDPPEVVVDLRTRLELAQQFGAFDASKPTSGSTGLMLGKDEVRVLREEAVGMYEVAVLEAGSAAALKMWMDDHGYQYPAGMDAVCEEYVKLGWCFVAEKAKVGGKANVDPKPRMKGVDTKLPAGSTFDGHVQAMAFRFKTDKLILPMRLSAYNEGTMHNIVYLLTDGPRNFAAFPRNTLSASSPAPTSSATSPSRCRCGSSAAPRPISRTGSGRVYRSSATRRRTTASPRSCSRATSWP